MKGLMSFLAALLGLITVLAQQQGTPQQPVPASVPGHIASEVATLIVQDGVGRDFIDYSFFIDGRQAAGPFHTGGYQTVQTRQLTCNEGEQVCVGATIQGGTLGWGVANGAHRLSRAERAEWCIRCTANVTKTWTFEPHRRWGGSTL